MYTTYFGFSDPPFENNLDQRFFYLSEGHREVLAALLYFVREGKGFALVCGDVGTGKTMLINCLLDRLPPAVNAIIVADADVSYGHLLRYIAGKLDIPAGHKTSLELFDEVKKSLIEARQQGGRLLLIIDEAHLLSHEALEGVRLLSNLETRREKLLQILLVGQNELSQKLDQPNMRQLRQRININRFLFPMDPEESVEYIDHRLKCVGGSFEACFEPGCRRLIHKMTEGVPRRINLLCDHALLICQAENAPKVTPKILKLAHEALRSDLLGSPNSGTSPSDSRRSFFRGGLKIAALLAVLVLAAAVASRALPESRIQGMLQRISASAGIFVRGFSDSLDSEKRSASAAISSPSPSAATKPPGAGPSAAEPVRPSKEAPRGLPPQSGKGTAQPKTPSADPPPGEPETVHAPQRVPQESTAGAAASVTASADGHFPRPPETRLADQGSSGPEAIPTDRVQEPVAVDVPGAAPRPRERPAAIPIPSRNASSVPAEPAAEPPAWDARAPQTDSQVPPAAPAERSAPVDPLESNGTESRGVRIVRRGDTLMRIATELNPQNPGAALQAILRLNPEITDKDRIYEGQILHLPSSRPPGPPLAPGPPAPFYALYGSYPSVQALEPIMNRMAQKGVRYIIVNAPAVPGGFVHEVIVGGYETREDLRRALDLLNE
ncbi:MAG: AAA family ATPase [Desulfosoma sp.]